MISGAKYSWVPTKELDRAVVGSTTSCGSGVTWAAKSGLSFRVFAAADKSLGVKQGTCHEGWRQKGCMQLESVHGFDDSPLGDSMTGDDLRRVGLTTAHRSDKSKSESMM